MNAEPIVTGTTAAHGAVFVLLMVIALVLVAAIEAITKHFRAKRNDRQVVDERRLRNGMKEARRRGWLPEDTQ